MNVQPENSTDDRAGRPGRLFFLDPIGSMDRQTAGSKTSGESGTPGGSKTAAGSKTRRRSRSALWVLIATVLSGATAARAQETPPPALPSLMKWYAAGGPQNPLEVTRLHASVAATGLSDLETGAAVQEKQKQVVAGLDAMIKELEDQERKKKQGTGGGPNPSKPAPKSTLAKGPGGSGPLHADRGGADRLAKLDDKQRDQIQQSTTEGFPAGYDSVLSNYYTRLAQEQSPGDTKPATPAAATPDTASPAPAAPSSVPGAAPATAGH